MNHDRIEAASEASAATLACDAPGPRGGAPGRELHGTQVACRHCAMAALCLPAGVDDSDLGRLERIIRRRRVLRRGEHLFRPGDPFRWVYAVKAGALKSYLPLQRGSVLVTGVHLPGELLALDAVGAGAYQYGMRALETTALCELRFDELEALGLSVSGVRRQLVRLAGAEVRHELLMRILHCRRCAESRVAAFLWALSVRLARRGLSALHFRLPMSRADMGSYLGLTKETVSRACSALVQRHVIEVAGKQVRILDPDALRTLAAVPAHLIC